MDIGQTVRRVKMRIAQVTGAVVVLVGLLLLLVGYPPDDAATGVVLVVGLVLALMGIGMIRNPEMVRFGNRRRYHDEDERELGPGGNRRRNRRRNRRFK